MDSIGKLRSALPQGENKRPWYTYCDEAMLVAAGLVYDKVFSSNDKGKPPTWDEIASIASSREPQLVYFDAMLMDRPSLFTSVSITTKTKPRESTVPEVASTSPSLSTVIPTPTIHPMLKRMAKDAPSTAAQPSKRDRKSASQGKKSTQVLARYSPQETTQSLGTESHMGPEAQPAARERASLSATVVNLDSSTTISDQGHSRQVEEDMGHLSLHEELNALFPSKPPALPDQQDTPEEETRRQKENAIRKDLGEASASIPPLPKYTGRYLATPYEVAPNLEITEDIPWEARKLHFHLARPLLSKKMAAQYTPLVDRYAAFAQAMKHMTQAINGSYVLARRVDHLAIDNNSLRYKGELAKVKEAAPEADKACVTERATLQANKDVLQTEKIVMQARYEELERAKTDESKKASEALDWAKKNAEATLSFTASQADVARI
ncbi:hypothetical protein LIER_17738 [Lithospermum erythrorhizon]|uniref:Uncharacterized protein n=1 Tax=Lithospermum erythrorhizon TaxID=34254 RepID=A0AAV3QBK1_LITER